MVNHKKFGLSMVLAVFICLSLATAVSATGQWSKFQADIGNTGQASVVGPSTNNTLWTYPTSNTMTQNNNLVIGDDGTLYFGIRTTKYLYAVNPNGTQKWSAPTAGSVFGEAIDDNGTIYASTASGSSPYNLYAFNPDGTQKWVSSNITRNLRGVTVANDTVYVGCDDGKLYAFYPNNGTVKWTYTTTSNAVMTGTPAVGSDGTIYIGNNNGVLYAINPDGTLKWSDTLGGQIQSGASIGSDGTIYVGSTNGYMYALNPDDGIQNWNYPTGSSIGYSTPAVNSTTGNIYFGASNGNVYALNTLDGSLNWTYPTGGVVYSSPVIGADGNIYVGSNAGKLYSLTSLGGLRWSYNIGSSVYDLAMSSNGTLYAANGGTNLYAFHD